MLIAAQPAWGTLTALVLFILASMWIGVLANRATRAGSFMKGFFLGNRGLGSWALALTATVQSGGTFMGYPSLVYTHGWSVVLWIAAYMVVPITGFGILGKRLAEISRRCDHHARPVSRAVRQPGARPARVAVHPLLYVVHDGRPVQSGRPGDEDCLGRQRLVVRRPEGRPLPHHGRRARAADEGGRAGQRRRRA